MTHLNISVPTAFSADSVAVLPNEIVLEIFTAYVGEQQPHAFSTARFAASPVKLTHVCRRWRNLLLRNPFFWSRIEVTADFFAGAEVDRVQTWLRRTGKYPLHLTLHQPLVSRQWGSSPPSWGGPHAADEKSDHLGSFLDVLEAFIQHTSHWKSVDFLFDAEFIADVIHFLGPENESVARLSMLESLTLNFVLQPTSSWYRDAYEDPIKEYEWSAHRLVSLSDTFHTSPTLRALKMSSRLSGATIVPWVRSSDLQWPSLTHLIFDFAIELRELIRTLVSCPKVQSIVASDVRTYQEAGELSQGLKPIQPPMVFEELRALRIEHAASLSSLFQYSTMPSLETLAVKGRRHEDIEDPAEFSSKDFRRFVRRSACSLKKFSVSYDGIKEQDLLDIFASVDTLRLTHLEVASDISTKGLKRIFLTESSGHDGAARPCLQNLSLRSCIGPKVDIEEVIRARSSCPSRHRIRSGSLVPMRFSDGVDTDRWSVETDN